MAGQTWDLYELIHGGSPVFALTDTVLYRDKSQGADEDQVQGVTLAKLLAFLLGGLQANIETLAGTKTLADTDVPVQSYDADGSDRDVNLPAEAADNRIFFIINSGATGNLVVKDDSGTTTYVTIEPGQMGILNSDGVTWAAVAGGGGGAAGLYPQGVVALTDGATIALDASLGNTFTVSAAGDRTILTPSNPVDGQTIAIVHHASGANRTLTLTTGSAGAFAFGDSPTALTATISAKRDLIVAKYNLAVDRWLVVGYAKGY